MLPSELTANGASKVNKTRTPKKKDGRARSELCRLGATPPLLFCVLLFEISFSGEVRR